VAKGRSKKKLSKKEEKALIKKPALTITQKQLTEKAEKLEKEKKIIEIGESITVRDFASLLNLPVTEVIKVLMKNGILKTLNESIDGETAVLIGDELGFEVKLQKEKSGFRITKEPEIEGVLVPRPPIVTVMGHVDHGKTKLLDVIRQTDVISTEAGGITQHIGAYQIEYNGKKITFIDTPGHEAFEKMRAHGANITDIVVLVVAADEGVKSQTIEAYEHAKRAGVPVIVAINKIDLPNANVFKVKQQLFELGLMPEDMGGKTITVPVSAKQNLNIDELLEMILLFSEMKDYKANPQKPASGVVIESHLDPKLGPVASLLVQDGTLKEGDFLVLGRTWGKVRLMEDEHKKRLKKAGPAKPVQIAGIKELPVFGDVFQVVPDEKTAEEVINELKKTKVRKEKPIFGVLEKEYPIVLKTDVLGSLEAIKDNLKKIKDKEVSISIVKEGVGDITEDDVMMAKASKAEIFGFKVKTFVSAQKLAEQEKIKISVYAVIYDLIEAIKEKIALLAKKEIETLVGEGVILRIFRATRSEKIIGLKLEKGKIEKGLSFKAKRDGKEIGQGKIISLQIKKEKVNSVEAKAEVGLGLATESDLKEGDIIEFYKKEIK
jgi:translation initiation factor IF-2